MSIPGKIAFLSLASVLCAFSDSITFNGPFGPTDGSVKGRKAFFDLQDAIITSPSSPGGFWTLTIHTNYGDILPGTGDNALPSFYDGGTYFSAADFLITWGGVDYGIVLHSHNGYISGDLYQANGFQTAFQALADPATPEADYNPTLPVWLAAGGAMIGAGIVSSELYGDGRTQASYTITDEFMAPAGFLSTGNFLIQFSSSDCANGYMSGVGSPGGTPTPETGTLLLLGCGLGLLYCKLRSTQCKSFFRFRLL